MSARNAMGGGCHGIVTGGTSAFGEDMGVLADRTIVAALAAYPISRRGSTFNRWFNASLAVDHLEATTGHDRIDLETRVLEWALEHAGGYELVTLPTPNRMPSQYEPTTELPTLEIWLPYQEWQRFPEHRFPSGSGRDCGPHGSAAATYSGYSES